MCALNDIGYSLRVNQPGGWGQNRHLNVSNLNSYSVQLITISVHDNDDVFLDDIVSDAQMLGNECARLT